MAALHLPQSVGRPWHAILHNSTYCMAVCNTGNLTMIDGMFRGVSLWLSHCMSQKHALASGALRGTYICNCCQTSLTVRHTFVHQVYLWVRSCICCLQMQASMVLTGMGSTCTY